MTDAEALRIFQEEGLKVDYSGSADAILRAMRKAAINAIKRGAAEASKPEAWIVASWDDKRFRMWGQSGPEWTVNKDDALHFYRRQDAEAFAAEDEDAWSILPVNMPPTDMGVLQAQLSELREENIALAERLRAKGQTP